MAKKLVLNKKRRERLDELEEAIKQHLTGFMVVGNALIEIRDDKLYRETHPTFEAWAKMRFNISRRRAYELISAVDVRNNLERHGAQILPQNERQVRDLAKYDDDEQMEVWEQAHDLAAGADFSEKHVRQAIRERNRQEQVKKLSEISKGDKALDLGTRSPIIMADPPWQYDSGTTDPSRQIENQYPTMPLDEIMAMDVGGMATDDAILFLWAVPPLLPEALRVMAAWGSTYKTNLCWDKGSIGPGYWFRNQHEHLLLGTRGNPPKPAPGERVSSMIHRKRGKHSVKPKEVRELIEAYYPGLLKTEVFARGTAPEGWDVWGNQAGDGS